MAYCKRLQVKMFFPQSHKEGGGVMVWAFIPVSVSAINLLSNLLIEFLLARVATATIAAPVVNPIKEISICKKVQFSLIILDGALLRLNYNFLTNDWLNNHYKSI